MNHTKNSNDEENRDPTVGPASHQHKPVLCAACKKDWATKSYIKTDLKNDPAIPIIKVQPSTGHEGPQGEYRYNSSLSLTFKRRIKSHLPFAGIIRSSPYSPRFQDNG